MLQQPCSAGKRECCCAWPISGQLKLKLETETVSDQLGQLLLVEVLHHLAHVLGMLARGHQQRVVGLDDHQVLDAHGGDEFAGRMDVVAVRVEGEALLRLNDVDVLACEPPRAWCS